MNWWSHTPITLLCLLVAFHALSYTFTIFQLHPVHYCYTSLLLSWFRASVTLLAIQGLLHITIWSWQCTPVSIKFHHSCSPAPVTLANAHTRGHAHTHTLMNRPFIWWPQSVHELYSCMLRYCTFLRRRWWPLHGRSWHLRGGQW